MGAQLPTETAYEDSNYDNETNLVWRDDKIDISNIDHTNDSKWVKDTLLLSAINIRAQAFKVNMIFINYTYW